MSKETKRVADAVKPVLSGALSAQIYAALVAIPGIGPVFAWPVISTFVKAILDRVAEWLVQETAVGLSLLWIQVEMAYEIDSAEKAAEKLRDMIDNPQKYSAKEQQKIDEYFDDTTVEIIQLGIDRIA